MSIWSSISDALLRTPDWLTGVVVLTIAAIAALIVHRIVFRLLGRAFGERRLRCIVGGQYESATGAARRERHGERAAYRAQLAGQ